ncbi:MAG: protein translocase subunit SecF [Gemmatimonadetes bacterium]|nr:protein translocase subunit SecF [Gemmatimonadota bacterium]
MFRLFAHAHYDFLHYRNLAYGLTIAFVIAGLIPLFVRGLNESIEFTGGTLMQIHAGNPDISSGSLRSALDAGGITGAEIQTFGAPDEFVIRARLDPRAQVSEQSTQQTAAAVDSVLTHTFGAESFQIVRTEAVGPKVGGELRSRAILAVLLSFGATLLYLWFRFEWRFSVAAILATGHDIITTVAFISLLHLEISLVVVAALLTIVGYSLNDTIITMDRMRENLRKFKRANLYEIINLSVNETLPRTILSSGTTLVATLALLIFGGEVIRPFAWVMAWGIVTGTFSSIFIASPVLLAIEQKWPGEDVAGVKTYGAAAPPTKPTPGPAPRTRRGIADAD